MVIRIIEEERTIKLSVRDVTRKNSADLSDASSVSPSLLFALRMGQDAHQILQDSKKQEDETYSAEFSVSYKTFVEVDKGSWKVLITGRADAVLQTDEGLLLDEYKSVSSFDHFNDIQDLPTSWVQQVQLYGYILASQGHAIKTRLVLVALGTHETKAFEFPIEDQQELIERKTREIIQEFRARKQQTRMKSQYAELLQFPFATFRPHQEQLIDRISEILEAGGRYLYSAPTGMGKTAASLYPALQFALQRGGMKVFFATAKGTQQVIAGTTFQQLVAQNPGPIVPKGIILRAKEKMCPQDELLCGDGLCPLLVNYMKAEGKPLVAAALEHDLVLPDHIIRIAESEAICPFELSLDVSLECDLIICDYNYVFHPTVALRRFFLDKRYVSNYILIIDEGHNLLDRARGYYSPELRRGTILSCRVLAARLGNEKTYIGLRRITERLLSDLSTLVKHAKPFREEETFLVDIEEQNLKLLYTEFEELTRQHVSALLEKGVIPSRQHDAILHLYSQFKEFARIYEIFLLFPDLFSLLYDEIAGVLKIFCKDPSPLLASKIAQFWTVIAQSATLEPFPFYRDLLGFPDDCMTEAFPSPFPKENLLVASYPHISTRFADRQKTLNKLRYFIETVLKATKGNYIIFMPSFQYLNQLSSQLEKKKLAKLGFQFIYQKPSMTTRDRRRVLTRFEQESGVVLMGVSGGIFAEGIDLIGEALHGVIIIGPGLPAINAEQELLRNYFEKTKGKGMGFKYAYRNPGMTRVIQAAGRVIRSETDRGIVILIGQRFTNTYYNELFPAYWYYKNPHELVMNETELSKKLEEFWKQEE